MKSKLKPKSVARLLEDFTLTNEVDAYGHEEKDGGISYNLYPKTAVFNMDSLPRAFINAVTFIGQTRHCDAKYFILKIHTYQEYQELLEKIKIMNAIADIISD